MAKFLVINADDFGYCPKRNQGIVTCFQQGVISSVSLMVNCQYTTKAVELGKGCNIPMGLHFNITEGSPVTKSESVPSLVDSSGCFLGKMGFREALKHGKVQCKEVELELEAQIQKFKCLVGEVPYHVDGHQHVHVLPGVCESFAQISSKYGVQFTRVPEEEGLEQCEWLLPGNQCPLWQSRDFFQTITDNARQAKSSFKQYNIRFTNSFVGSTTMGSNMTTERLQSCLSRAFGLKRDAHIACELMVHPGFPSDRGVGGTGQGPDEFSMSTDRQHEIDILTSAEMKNFYKKNDINISSFKDLTA